MPSEDFLGIKAFKQRDAIGMGIIAAIALAIFAVWGMQTRTKIVTYKGDYSSEVSRSVNEGWKIIDTDTERQAGEFIGRTYMGDEVVTVVTLERSNWSKLWND